MKTTKQLIFSATPSPTEYVIKEHIIGTIQSQHANENISVVRIKHSIMNPADKRKYSAEETVKRIVHLTEELTSFWKSPEGWAPIEAAALLTKSRLDWQASLARQLKLFLDKSNTESGYLILAWATLGSLTEGALKLFLSVYYNVYQTQNLLKEFKAVKDKKGNLLSPDGLMLEKLRLFFADRVFPKDAKEQWKRREEVDWLEWLQKVQQRRNAIHAFKNKDIGDIEEFHSELQNYLIFLRQISNGLPYPDEPFIPAEDPSDKCPEGFSIEEDGILVKGVIKKRKLFVASEEHGKILKERLGRFLLERLYDPNAIEVVDNMFLLDLE